MPTTYATELDTLTRAHSAFRSFRELVEETHPSYRPSIDCRDAEKVALADAYDAAQEARGDARRAYRYGQAAAVPEPVQEPVQEQGHTKVLRYGGSFFVLLDRREVYLEDPGAGTPAMVYLGKYSASLWCALSTGEVTCPDDYRELTGAQYRWLESIQDDVEAFLYAETY
jgi:hypothetical protein